MDVHPSFEFAKEFTTQLITLSTAVIGVSVTFAKDVSPGITAKKRWLLYFSWIVFLLSIIAGILTIGSLARLVDDPNASIMDGGITNKSRLQFCLFLLGVLLLIIDGIREFAKRGSTPHS